MNKLWHWGRRFRTPSNATVIVSGGSREIDSAKRILGQAIFLGNARGQLPFSLDGIFDWDSIPKMNLHQNNYIQGLCVDIMLPGPTIYNAREEHSMSVIRQALSFAVSQSLSTESGIDCSAGAQWFQFSDVSVTACGAYLGIETLDESLKLLRETIATFPNSLRPEILTNAYTKLKNQTYLAADLTRSMEEIAVRAHRPYVSKAESLKSFATLTFVELQQTASKYLDVNKARIVLHGSEQII